jgi:heme exporter protein B
MSVAEAEAGFVAKTLTLARKDLRIELRARDTLPPMIAFSLAVTLLLAFTLPGSADLSTPVELPSGTVALADVLAGFLWVTVLFAGLIGFARAFEVERDEGAIDSLLLVPMDRSGLFAAKALANLAYIATVEAVLVPVFGLLFDLNMLDALGELLLVVVLVDIGFVSVGTLFASVAAQTRSRELILPILALPALVPVFIAAFELTSDLFLGAGTEVHETGWFGLLLVFDVVFTTLGSIAFEFVIE